MIMGVRAHDKAKNPHSYHINPNIVDHHHLTPHHHVNA